MKKKQEVAVFWFRRDLRLEDNTGLSEALRSPWPVLPLFLFDTEILEKLDEPADARVEFIHRTVLELDRKLRAAGSALLVRHGRPSEVFAQLLEENQLRAVYTNHDYEPQAIARDRAVEALLAKRGVELKTFKDQVVFERKDVVKDDGNPYTVFTPYSKKWRAKLTAADVAERDCRELSEKVLKYQAPAPPTLEALGFKETGREFPAPVVDRKLLARYGEVRDFPAEPGTTRLGIHLRFGTVSARELVKAAQASKAETWLGELIWREFFMQILANFPHVATGPFRPEYARIKWRNNQKEFERWCKGETGVPIVDAGMRELNATGFMHNRVRMITASFLVKQLLIDWRWGEAYFAKKLLDYDLAANNGNWQWVAGCGCDAAPYFRVFNPEIQAKKFDRDGKYVKLWVPEVATLRYPEPMVDLKTARVRALQAYAVVKGK
jgi:deoxyribodipyrimidine photo-lyase